PGGDYRRCPWQDECAIGWIDGQSICDESDRGPPNPESAPRSGSRIPHDGSRIVLSIRISWPLEPDGHRRRRWLLSVAIGFDGPTGRPASHDERHESFERWQRLAAGVKDTAQFPLSVDDRCVSADATDVAEHQRMLGRAIFLTHEERSSIRANRLTPTL